MTTALWPAAAKCVERVFDGGADPGSAGDALALEGEEPVGFRHADGSHALRDGGGGCFALDGIGVAGSGRAVVLDAVGGNGSRPVHLRRR